MLAVLGPGCVRVLHLQFQLVLQFPTTIFPAFKSNVTIKPCNDVVLDVDINVQLMSIVVRNDAILTVQSRPGASYNLRALCIWVWAGGKIRAGTPDAPFEGSLNFQLSGDEFTEMPQCNGKKGRTFDVEGELSLHGTHAASPWSRLRASTAIGDQRLVVQGSVDWRDGDNLLVATTSSVDSGTE